MAKVLALDLGAEFGYCTSPKEAHAQKIKDIDFSPWRVNGKDKPYIALYQRLAIMAHRDAIDVIAIENAIGQIAFANEKFHAYKTISTMVAQYLGIELIELSPAHIKKVFAGNAGKVSEDEYKRIQKKHNIFIPKAEINKSRIIDKCLSLGISLPTRTMKAGPNKGKMAVNANAADAAAVYHTYRKDNS